MAVAVDCWAAESFAKPVGMLESQGPVAAVVAAREHLCARWPWNLIRKK